MTDTDTLTTLAPPPPPAALPTLAELAGAAANGPSYNNATDIELPDPDDLARHGREWLNITDRTGDRLTISRQPDGTIILRTESTEHSDGDDYIVGPLVLLPPALAELLAAFIWGRK
jgi:hypothetical protein